ncbi:protein odr-4 homolog [Selaginella moellendorffii]|uniref:protein odr-4 homolog n=1 Tax=Selaginella moellendorffii TaxID=88036 RepID=UPI000D1C2585|nr:protein odr-4 homolog [Selaginella moellendorffii]|eukprot:XP_002973942.2 protein odr-4 homolog [Selaginella moellendorffii]
MRTVVGDEALDGAVDSIVAAGRAVALGLLIGRLGSGGRDFVVGLVQTPVKEDGGDAAVLLSSSGNQSRSRSGAGSMALSIDAEWVAEHARQISRMLLGGLGVVGLYCLAPDSAFKQSTAILCQVSNAVAAVTSISAQERFVLQISTSPRRLACKVCTVEPNGSSSLKPCEWKLAKISTNLQSLTCTYSFDASIPVRSAAQADTFKNKLLSWTASEIKVIQSAEVLINNELQEGENYSGDVQLLLPFNNKEVVEGDNPAIVTGNVNVKGSVDARAYGFPREPASMAIDAIKEDIIASLRNRIDILCEEAEQQSAEQAPLSLLSHCGQDRAEFILPRRVLLPWNELLICDYLLPSETDKEIRERYTYLFGQELPGDILQSEKFFTLTPADSKTSKISPKGEARSKFFSLISALFGILIPILVALAVALFRK